MTGFKFNKPTEFKHSNGLVIGQLLWKGTITVPAPTFHMQITNWTTVPTVEELEVYNETLAAQYLRPGVEGDW